MAHLPVKISSAERGVKISARWPRKKEVAFVGTAAARIRNMIRGVVNGYTYKMKVVYAHFPITIKVDEKDRRVIIENFIGEKTPRVARIVGDVKVKVVGDEILVQGIRLEDVSQTAANIQSATKIRDKDQRVFLDGIYISEKGEGM
jgi:large subunit ribosomal protein L6